MLFPFLTTLHAVLVNSVQVAFVQEYRSEQSLQALTTLLPPHATCLRGGKVSERVLTFLLS